jgi:succinate dehydrogenase / fumarate reductase cytochrome b subunit
MRLIQLQKKTMALAGTIMTLYLLFHMLTNLSYFFDDAFERFYTFYNQVWIRWPVLVLFLLAIAVHVHAAVIIRKRNAAARTVGYAKHDYLHIPAPLVTISIILLFGFIGLHVLQTLCFDTASVTAEVDALFSSALMTLIYLAGLFILGMHLSHSLMNVLQTLGISARLYKMTFLSFVAILTLGFAAVPIVSWMQP